MVYYFWFNNGFIGQARCKAKVDFSTVVRGGDYSSSTLVISVFSWLLLFFYFANLENCLRRASAFFVIEHSQMFTFFQACYPTHFLETFFDSWLLELLNKIHPLLVLIVTVANAGRGANVVCCWPVILQGTSKVWIVFVLEFIVSSFRIIDCLDQYIRWSECIVSWQ